MSHLHENHFMRETAGFQCRCEITEEAVGNRTIRGKIWKKPTIYLGTAKILHLNTKLTPEHAKFTFEEAIFSTVWQECQTVENSRLYYMHHKGYVRSD